jgi:hypothetical protein
MKYQWRRQQNIDIGGAWRRNVAKKASGESGS